MNGNSLATRWRESAIASAASSGTHEEVAEAVSSALHRGAASQGVAWDPYDVWLKRVKQPREQRVAAESGDATIPLRRSLA